MLDIQMIPARNLQKSYKSIIEGVKKGDRAVVLTSNNQSQAAIISLEDLDKLQQSKTDQGIAEILKFVEANKAELKTLPTNLREIADDILYKR